MKKVFLLFILNFFGVLYAQENNNYIYTITGKVVDATAKNAIEDATIIFKNSNTGDIEFGGITNSKGNFSVDVKQGNYIVSVQILSYKTSILNITKVSKDIHLGNVKLEPDTRFLTEINIISQKKTLDFKANKIILNVNKSIASSNSATEILNSIPSVSVDPDGEITVGGKGHVQVMINGKTSTLSKSEALKSLPAGSIEKINVITNPSAKYKASSLSVINIILKKGKDIGLNASITTTGGYKDYYGALLTLNNKTKFINFYVNTSYSNSNPIKTSHSENEHFKNGDTYSFLNEKSEFNNKQRSLISNIGADFFISKNTTLSTAINLTTLNYDSRSNTKSDFFNASHISTLTNNRDYISDFENEIFEFTADFEHQFKKKGTTLIASIVYSKDSDTRINSISNSSSSFTNQNYNEEAILKNTIFDISYGGQLGEKSTYAIGYTGEFGKNPFKYSETDINNYSLDYFEDLHQAYMIFDNTQEKLYFSVGLRGEFAESKLNYHNKNTKLSKNYNDILPSATIEYQFNDANNISLSYREGIFRPTSKILRPFEEKISETSSYFGNENINPIYYSSNKLVYTFSGKKITIIPSLFFDIYKDFWQNITYQTGEQINGIDKIITTPKNLGRVNHYGLNITSNYKVNNALNISGNINIYNFDQTGSIQITNSANQIIDLNYDYAYINGSFSLLAQLKLPDLFNFQLNTKHNLNSKGAYSTRKAYTYANMAINKELFDSEASISLTVDDLFLSKETNRDRYDINYISKSLIKNKYRTILVSFTYRFNQSKKNRKINFNKKDINPNY